MTEYRANRPRHYRLFEEAREFARSLNLKSFQQWRDYSKSGVKPHDIPTDPRKVYGDQGWKGFADWLGKQEEGKEQSSTALMTQEVRSGIEILYSDLPDMEKIRLLEELLRPADSNRNWGYSYRSMASKLGIPFRKFRYQLLKNYLREGDRCRRHSVRQTKALLGAEITSQKLGFELWLPKDWKVGGDTDEYGEEPHLNERGETVPAVSGFWNATGETTTIGAPSDLLVEVSKYQLDEPLTSLDLYQRCAPRWPEVATSRRPSSPLRVSGMEAIRYTARLWPMSNAPTPAVCAIYMSDGITGWEVNLWGGHGDTAEAFVISYGHQKALFSSRIAPSFRTLI